MEEVRLERDLKAGGIDVDVPSVPVDQMRQKRPQTPTETFFSILMLGQIVKVRITRGVLVDLNLLQCSNSHPAGSGPEKNAMFHHL